MVLEKTLESPLDCEEGWAPKNWCYWTVMLEKTLESSLDCREIQPVHPKGNQSWIFIGRTEAEAPILRPPVGKSWLIRKDPDAGKAGGEGDDRGRDDWMASLTQRTWVWANLGRWWRIGKPGVLQSMGSQRVRHDWVTELNWTEWKMCAFYRKSGVSHFCVFLQESSFLLLFFLKYLQNIYYGLK